MPYGIDTSNFQILQEQVENLTEEFTVDTNILESVLFSYLQAVETLFGLMKAILLVCAERDNRRKYPILFIPIYDSAVARVLKIMENEIRAGYSTPEENLIEFTYAIRDSEIASELVILSQSLDLDDDATPEDHLITTKTVTDSVKKQIEMYIKKKWISNILHTINEVISIIKGVG